jgi:hypothetical protein
MADLWFQLAKSAEQRAGGDSVDLPAAAEPPAGSLQNPRQASFKSGDPDA